MKKLILIAIIALPALLNGQTTTENYIKSTNYKVPITYGDQSSVLDEDKIETVSYYDGLGRPIESIVQRAGGQGQGLVQITDYDELGRMSKNYLPMRRSEANGGNFWNLPNVKTAINTFYKSEYPEDRINTSTINAYSETIYDGSWENRPVEQGSPGKSWMVDPISDNDHTVKFEYLSNTISIDNGNSVVQGDDVMLFKVSYPTYGDLNNPILELDGFYQDSELFKLVTKDENWTTTSGKNHTTETYKDRSGRVVLKRNYNENTAHDTYYAYDSYENLIFVLPPKATDDVRNSIGYGETLKFISWKNFNTVSGSSGIGGVTVSISGNEVMASFDLSLSPTQVLRNGSYGSQLSIPDVELGILNVFGPGNPYNVQIIDGYLYISGNRNFSSLNQTLTAVLPPPEGIVNSSTIEMYGYEYHYDGRNRVVEKRIPGKDWEYIVYDPLDRPILVQSGNLRKYDQWLFTKYDALGRVVYTGLYNSGSCDEKQSRTTQQFNKWDEGTTSKTTSRSTNNTRNCKRISLQNILNSQSASMLYEESRSVTSLDGTDIFYTNQAFPTSNLKLHTINYYDNYNFDWNYGSAGSAGLPSPITVNSFGQAKADNIKGMSSGSKIRVLDTDNWIISYIVYDEKRRPIFNASYNKELLNTNISKIELDFVGQPLQTELEHSLGAQPPIIVKDFYTYDSQGRQITHKQQIDSQPLELIFKNEYDSMGLLSRKRVGGPATTETGLQQIDYSYNIRGWMNGVNEEMINNPTAGTSDLFGYHINYDTVDTNTNGFNDPLYNGNISETIWRTINSDDDIKGYAYEYDAFNRLSRARFAAKGINASSFIFDGTQQERIDNYDKNGNILSLFRSGPENTSGRPEVWDDLDFSYIGNKLIAVREKNFTSSDNRDEGFVDNEVYRTEYGYDVDGNLTSDRNKGINSISYNHLNLPTRITTGDGTVDYVYDAIGTKLKKVVDFLSIPTNTKIYDAGFIYTNDVLSLITQPEGYVEPDGNGSFTYAYNYIDHLGNVRLTYKDSNGNGSVTTSEIIEEKNYFPFGLQHKGYNYIVQGENSAATQFGYNGMENNPELGLEILDFGARYYDAALGRWMNIDPLAETMRRHSPYNFAFNNPVYFIDPDGMSPVSSMMTGNTLTASSIENSAFGNQTFGAQVGLEGGAGLGTGSSAGAPPSTHVDSDGNVISVKNDGDNSVYAHSNGTSTEDIDSNHSENNTSAGGSQIGETEYWDEFVSPETNKAMTNVQLKIGKSWDQLLAEKALDADGMNLKDIASKSGPGGVFDIKNDYPNEGRLLNEKYATSRSAGNYLAGYNAQGGSYFGVSINFKTFQKLAGGLHVLGSLSFSQKAGIVLGGASYGPAPTYGEVNYQYRMSRAGWIASILEKN